MKTKKQKYLRHILKTRSLLLQKSIDNYYKCIIKIAHGFV